MPLTTEQSEAFYDRLAEAIDRAGPQDESLFLTKLALLLAHAVGNARTVDAAVDQALAQLGSAPPSRAGQGAFGARAPGQEDCPW